MSTDTNTVPFSKGAVVVTSISHPNKVLQAITQGCSDNGSSFIIVGDSKSPDSFSLDGSLYFSLAAQEKLPFAYAQVCPVRNYARKNIGYLAAIQNGARFIAETDDDNYPTETFWEDRSICREAEAVVGQGWQNVYACFADSFIYPRGFPLNKARSPENQASRESDSLTTVTAPIQQGLADENPDVDAVYRMLFPLPFVFNQGAPVFLKQGQWCPFNSQNTTFFPQAFPLLYLPTYCSFRMTDIWRSFVAQRVLWTCGWNIVFHSASVRQDRNEHDLMKDFREELSGYDNNEQIAETLSSLPLRTGSSEMPGNLLMCYEALVGLNWIGKEELPLLEAWLRDLVSMSFLPPE